NLTGHYFKLMAFYMIYEAVIETGLTKPYSILFREIEIKKEASESANLAKSQFLASMSHELRTPLNGILGYTQILKQEKELTERQTRAIDTIHRSGEHLLLMINDILDLSKIEAKKIELIQSKFYFIVFLKTIADIIQVQAIHKSLDFEYKFDENLPKGILADEKRLRQILLNLLNNAVKFTIKGKVIFHVSCIENKIFFHIEDTGIGIPSEKIDEIFSPFQQIHDRRFRIEGTGLGLSISRELVKLMGGNLEVKSILGKGSTFYFNIELPETEIDDSIDNLEYREIIGYEGKTRKILIVDDIQVNRMVLKEMLSLLKFEIEEAIDGHDAIEKAENFNPDLILMDFIMPNLSGFEATIKIKTSLKGANTVIIGTSADVKDQARDKGLAAGCVDFISKPVLADELLKKISHYLKLNWIYKNELKQLEPQIHQEIIPPSKEELDSLYLMADRGDIGAIQKYSKQNKEKEDIFKGFWEMIYQLSMGYQLGKIRKRITEYRKD
ncbi:MAG: response regulator, partial [Desulfobacterales bacterium]|nr:response regulator [Desulfobacterales bacterium]